MICWHKWKKWSDPYDGIFARTSFDAGYFHVCQIRKCEKCGKAEVRKLPAVRSVSELRKET